MRLPLLLLALAAVCSSSLLFAEDVFRFRGDNSQGKFNETGLLDRWPEGGLTPKWVNSELGEGWSSVIKVRDRLYLGCLDSNDSKKESIVCLDLNGKKIWQQPVGAVWARSYPFPRSTPTYVAGEKPEDDKLLVYSGNGELYCLAASDGKYLWHKEVAKTYESRIHSWGMAEAVVVKDGKVFVTVGGSRALAVAFNIADGSEVWKAEPLEDGCAYVTPILYNDSLIVMTTRYISVIDTKTGQRLAKNDFQEDSGGRASRWGNSCNSPIIKGNQFFVTQGYDQGGVMYEILPDGKGLKKLWAGKTLDPHHDGVVEIDGRIYGSNWLSNNAGNWCCLDWNTGKTIYEEPWGNLGKGVTIAADGKLYLYEERRGTLALAKPGDKLEIISSFQINFGTKEHWSHPVISDGVLYVRHGNSLAAFDIRKR